MAPFQHEDYLRLTGLGEPGEILNLLVQLSQKTKHDIKFFNYYKEVPVSAPVEFLYVLAKPWPAAAVIRKTGHQELPLHFDPFAKASPGCVCHCNLK